MNRRGTATGPWSFIAPVAPVAVVSLVMAALPGVGATACSRRAPEATRAAEAPPPAPIAASPAAEMAAGKPAPDKQASKHKPAALRRALSSLGGGKGAGSDIAGLLSSSAEPADEKAKDEGEGEPAAAPARAWFPETFLFAPLVVTNDAGKAKLTAHVPDRLTTWRVLALAHSRAGAQAGSEATFAGTLPTYVEPVVPGFLMSGDEVALPIQVVNTTSEPVTAPLSVELGGATLARPMGTVHVGPEGSMVAYALVRAGGPGTVTVRAALGGTDTVERSFPVHATGRPVTESRSGTLAAPRKLEIALPADAAAEGAVARLRVFPGALALLRSEIGAAAGRGDVAGDAYALLLAGRGEALLRSLGGEPQPAQLRALAIVAGQRVIRAARSPDTVTAALLGEAALAHPQSPVLARLGERLAATVAAGQRPDGTFAGGDGWTLQRLLAASADCVRAVRAAAPASEPGPGPGTGGQGAASPSPPSPPSSPHLAAAARQRASGATLRARGAFERNLGRIADGYTAAAILASGVFDDAGATEVRDQLRKLVVAGIQARPDGSRALPVGRGVVRADGTPPSQVEATALAVLALGADQASRPLVADLGASLLAAYDPAIGFGDGRTNLVALRAVLSLFKDPLPSRITVTLLVHGDDQTPRSLVMQALEGTKLREVLAVEVPLGDAAGRHSYEIRAEPPVPGLGYALTLRAFAPWPRTPAGGEGGLELDIDTPKTARLGKPAEIAVRAAAPAGQDVTIRHALPAGVEIDAASLEALVADGSIRAYSRQADGGAVSLTVPARTTTDPTFSVRYRVVPTLTGTFSAPASTISIPGHEYTVPPSRWKID
jgi:hypothetical protein